MLQQDDLKKIGKADFEENTSNGALLKQIQYKIGEKTNQFSDPSGISDVKIDMTDDILASGKTVEQYKKKFGSVMRSEEDVCKHLIDEIDGKTKPKTTDDSDSDDDNDELILIAEAEAEAVNLLLALELEL